MPRGKCISNPAINVGRKIIFCNLWLIVSGLSVRQHCRAAAFPRATRPVYTLSVPSFPRWREQRDVQNLSDKYYSQLIASSRTPLAEIRARAPLAYAPRTVVIQFYGLTRYFVRILKYGTLGAFHSAASADRKSILAPNAPQWPGIFRAAALCLSHVRRFFPEPAYPRAASYRGPTITAGLSNILQLLVDFHLAATANCLGPGKTRLTTGGSPRDSLPGHTFRCLCRR